MRRVFQVFAHLLPGESQRPCVSAQPIWPSVCMCGVRAAEVTVSLGLQRNDLQGLLSLISIRDGGGGGVVR